jgi:hypothetical protein
LHDDDDDDDDDFDGRVNAVIKYVDVDVSKESENNNKSAAKTILLDEKSWDCFADGDDMIAAS